MPGSRTDGQKEWAWAHLEHLLEFGFLCGLDPCALDVEDVCRLVDRHAVVPRDGIDVASATSRSPCCSTAGCFTACSCVWGNGGGEEVSWVGRGPTKREDDSLRAACRHAWTKAFPRICEPRMTTCAITRGADCRRNRVGKKSDEGSVPIRAVSDGRALRRLGAARHSPRLVRV